MAIMPRLFIFAVLVMAVSANEQSLVAVKGNNKFAFDMYKLLAKEPGNHLFCPVSAETILALTSLGAKGNTATQMTNTLGLPDDRQAVISAFEEFGKALKSKKEGVIFHSLNKLFTGKGLKLHEEYETVTKTSFNSESTSVNYGNSPEAAGTINKWVEDKTNNKIKNLFESDAFTTDTRLVLVNAVYFLGKWGSEFKLRDSPMEFHLSATKTKQVPQMNQIHDFLYLDDPELKATILEMPYKNRDFVFTIVLPHEVDGLAAVEEKLPSYNFKQVREVFNVNVTMPKFKIEEKHEMNDYLKSLGMLDAFANNADFSGMSDEPLKIDRVIQKAFIEVDEKGTEAAAATGVQLGNRSFRKILKHREFVADRPCWFALRKKAVGVTLFMGRLVEP